MRNNCKAIYKLQSKKGKTSILEIVCKTIKPNANKEICKHINRLEG